jgi:hypothetical protein
MIPAQAHLRRLYHACLPIAEAAAARAPPAPPPSHEATAGDEVDCDVLAALQAGEHELHAAQRMHEAGTADTVHAITEAAVHVGASIVNHSLAQVCLLLCSVPALCHCIFVLLHTLTP